MRMTSHHVSLRALSSVVNLFTDLLTNPLRPAACILDNFQRFATLRARVLRVHVPLLRIRTRACNASTRFSRAANVVRDGVARVAV